MLPDQRQDSQSVYGVLQQLLQPPPELQSRLKQVLPCSGTLQEWNAPRSAKAVRFLPLLTGLRSLGQVIFINNPLSGALVLLAFLLESPWMALMAVAGTAGANITSRGLAFARDLRHQGIYGFNGALVGCALAALGSVDTQPLLWLGVVVLGGGLTTLMLEGWRWRFHDRGDPPALTLPFCLVTWVFLAVMSGLSIGTAEVTSMGVDLGLHPLQVLSLGVVRSFGQVFLCSGLGSGGLVLLATALASPWAAGLGVLGAAIGTGSAALLGASSSSLAMGLWGYNSVLVAIAVGGIFHPPGRRSLAVAMAGAALTVPLMGLQGMVLPSLPRLTLAFVLTTWSVLWMVRNTLPALIPVSVHALVSPEEHYERLQVARRELRDFRRRIQARLQGDPRDIGEQLPDQQRLEVEAVFRRLDRDGDGHFSLEELRLGLGQQDQASGTEDLAAVLVAMDRDGDGRVDLAEFTAIVVRLQRLRQGEQRLLHYLKPVDGNSDDAVDGVELDRLLRSVGEARLNGQEKELLFGPGRDGLRWHELVNRLLIT